MRVGAIDCGTNSIRLLIADSTTEVVDGVEKTVLKDVVREMRIVRLGQGVDATGWLAQEALDRTFAAAREYAQLLKEHGADSVRFVATSATRDAGNRQVFVDGIREILGIEPEVISGDEEAALSFAGAVRAVGYGDGDTLVFDLGGGSTEFVLGDESGVKASRSVNIGCVRLTERHMMSAPSTESQIARVEADTDEALEVARKTVPLQDARRVVAVAGTATTVAAAALGLDRYDSEAINAQSFSVETVQKTARWLASLNRQEREELGYMHPGRVDVIGAGATIYARILTRLNEMTDGAVDSVTVSEHDILDGIALSQL
mgnify:FL=1